MLEALNYLIKFSQQTSCFVCDMVAAVRLCQAYLFSWYVDLDIVYSTDVFQRFKDINTDKREVFSHDWRLDMNLGAETLSLWVGEITLLMHCWPHVAGEYVLVTQLKFEEIQHFVQQ